MAVIVTLHFLLFHQSGDQVVSARISRTDVVLPDYFERLRSSHAVRTKVGARVVGKGAEKLGSEPVPSIVLCRWLGSQFITQVFCPYVLER